MSKVAQAKKKSGETAGKKQDLETSSQTSSLVAGKATRPKRQQRDSRRGDDDESNNGEDDGEEEEDDADVKPAANSRSGRSGAAAGSSNNTNTTEKGAEDDRVWVQCNTCDKWRALPSTVDPNSLPDIWVCELNIYDTARNNCEVCPTSQSCPRNVCK
jgi:cobalamin biosynthesis protein CobT